MALKLVIWPGSRSGMNQEAFSWSHLITEYLFALENLGPKFTDFLASNRGASFRHLIILAKVCEDFEEWVCEADGKAMVKLVVDKGYVKSVILKVRLFCILIFCFKR